jgi:uncharacterized membrane protein YphA (DoxX/SURF4 family)
MANEGPIRAVARPLLASIFVFAGYQAARDPQMLAPRAAKVTDKVAPKLAGTPVPGDAESLVRINGGVQVAAGAMLAVGVAPRLCAAVLAASLVPTSVAGHAFWEETDPAARKMHQIQFAKNLSILGGLLMVVAKG